MDGVMQEWGGWGLFLSAFISSTLLPGGSEALLLALALNGGHDPWLLLGVATAGNTLGGMTSWLLGRWLVYRFPLHDLGLKRQRAVARLQRYGSPLLLLSWLPLIGDPLCVAAGWLKINPFWSLLFIALGKGGRYGVILWLAFS
jgi:membrane protein YqaA with SNARE-associated domain